MGGSQKGNKPSPNKPPDPPDIDTIKLILEEEKEKIEDVIKEIVEDKLKEIKKEIQSEVKELRKVVGEKEERIKKL